MFHRDMDLIRLLLLDLEGAGEIDLSDYTEDQILYHKYLLIDAKFAEGTVSWGKDNHRNPQIISARTFHLTWEGTEFLANAKNENVWGKAMKTVAQKGGSISLAVLQGLLIQYAKSELGLT